MAKLDTIQKSIKERKVRWQHWQVIALYLVIYDILAVNLAYLAALFLRFDGRYSMIPQFYLTAWMNFVPVYSVFCIVVFWFLRLYKSLWRFASYDELVRVIVSTILTAAFHAVCITLFVERMPVSYYIFGAFIQFMMILGIRFSYRFILLERSRRNRVQKEKYIMLIGAGSAGRMILRDIDRKKEQNERVCCIIDDNPNKWGRYLDGVPIVGGRDDILANVEKYQIDKIYMAIPSLAIKARRDILNICKETKCELKNLPDIYRLESRKVTTGDMKDVDVVDLLGRDPIKVNMDEIFQSLSGKVILVTGGGGSIGSELCRQIAGHGPKQLIIFDIYENNAYEIQQELADTYPDLNLVVLIGSVRDSRKINQVFADYKPDVVYHAAAHKHVPLMEDSPCESIKNNAIGTYKTAYAAMTNGCQRFVLISTDKAVNPTNIMGASKRLCEMIVQTFDKMIREGRAKELTMLNIHSEDELSDRQDFPKVSKYACTEFVAVRFGNVLGSNGSVIPKFKKQIAKGGPVTVTHPDIIRYFMTIPEAVSLVLQAGAYAKGGEIFVLDMGDPVKIDTLARNLIKLSGFKPDVDIKISYTGLRPGEKLYEEKLMAEEGMKTTQNSLIYIGRPIAFDTDLFLQQIRSLMEACYENRSDIRALVQKIVPTYQPQDAQVQALDIQMQDVQVQSQAPDAFPKSAIQEAILSKIAAQEAAFPKAAVRETGLRRSAPHGKIVDKYEKKEKYEKSDNTYHEPEKVQIKAV